MMEEGKISYKQVLGLIVMTISPTAILYLPTINYKEAKQDGWIAILIAAIYAIIVSFIINQLNMMYKDKTIIQYSQDIVGKFVGKVIGFIYCLLFIHLDAVIIREFAEVLSGPFMPETPQLFFIIGIVLPSIYGVYKGLEVIARTNQIIFLIFIVAVFAILILGIKDMDFSKLQPILAEGFKPVLKGASRQISWFSQTIILAFIMPFINVPEKVGKMSFYAIVFVGFMLICVNIGLITTFGSETQLLNYPFLSFARYVRVFDFIERLDSIIMFMWIGGVYIKIVVFHYCAVIAVSQLFNIKDYRIVSAPVGLILIVLSYVLWGGLTELKEEIAALLILAYAIVQAGIPTLLIIIEKIKRRFITHEK